MKAPEEVKKLIKEMVDKLVAEYKPEKIILFGSYAYGVPDLESDVDLLILKETRMRFFDRCFNVRKILSDPKRFIPLEIIVLTPVEYAGRLDIGDQFMQEIDRKGEVLYAA
ncbi:MAG: nucleotidyltransferase domain-containing protein [Candidatus Eremiobacteraeota bacterium]|nr:nucleotidyltransferase domain-containing protein [Candidatus Eremiobacteraeota bacterium]